MSGSSGGFKRNALAQGSSAWSRNLLNIDSPAYGGWQFAIRPNASGSYDVLSSHPETNTWQSWPEHSGMSLPDALQLLDDYRSRLGG